MRNDFFGRSIKPFLYLSILLTSLLGVSTAMAQPVDLELALLVDVSGSISDAEFDLQKEGYAAAFESSEVKNVLQGKTVAVAAIFWAGDQQLVIDWKKVDSPARADDLAGAFRRINRSLLNIGANQTNVGSALAFGRQAFDGNGYESSRKIIDISGNGVVNGGLLPVSQQRDLAVQAGITINGIVVGNEAAVVAFYRDEVVGGPNHFLSQANDFSTFAQVIKNKLVREIGNATSNNNRISLSPASSAGPVGGSHVLTAKVTGADGVTPQAGVQVTFKVLSGPNANLTGTRTTDGSGNATFSYADHGGAGQDTVQACFVDNASTEICANATRNWQVINGAVTMTPNRLSRIVATTAVLTAKVTDGSPAVPVAGAPVVFTVVSGPNTGANGLCSPNPDCTTDANGQVTFSYPGINGVGADTVRAATGASQATSTVTWIDPTSGGNNGDNPSNPGGGTNPPTPGAGDSDFDGLSDAEESRLGTDPNDPDTDNDGLLDGREAGPNGTGTDPKKRDTDNDDIPDGVEAGASGPGTDPLNPDTDGDGLLDGVELSHTPTPTDPLNPDTDGDGRLDGVEDANHNGRVDPGETDPRIADAPVSGSSGNASPPASGGDVLGAEGQQRVLAGVNGGLGSIGWLLTGLLGVGAMRRRRRL